MQTASFIVADLTEHHDTLLDINIEYVSWVLREIENMFGVRMEDAVGMPVPEYVAGTLDKVCGERPPQGMFYLLDVDGAVAGMCGLRPVHSGIAEIKRLYVRPAFRGMRLGETALRRLIADATRFGYQSVCLDTGPFMQAAQHLYEAQGFVDCAAYAGVEVPPEFHAHWRFMQRPLP